MMSLTEKIALFAQTMNIAERTADERQAMEAYQAAMQRIDPIDLSNPTVLREVMSAATGRRTAHEDGKNQTSLEETWQAFLADVLTDHLPKAYDLSPENFMAEALDDDQKATAAYLLGLNRQKPSPQVEGALKVVCAGRKLSVSWWKEFIELGAKMRLAPGLTLAKKGTMAALPAESFLDSLMLKLAKDLDPETAQRMNTDRRVEIFKSLLGPVGLGRVTPDFESARRAFLVTFDIPPEVLQRQQDLLDQMAENWWGRDHLWRLNTKKTWRFYSSRQKEKYLDGYHDYFAELLDLPQIPCFEVRATKKKSRFLRDDSARNLEIPDPLPTCDGSFLSWTVQRIGNVSFGLSWVNHIVLYDGPTEMGRDCITSFSLRSALCALFHEDVHSSDYQREARLPFKKDRYAAYCQTFKVNPAPEPLSPQDPLYAATVLCTLFSEKSARRAYVTIGGREDLDDSVREIYQNQPIEKYANSCDALAAGIINGSLVLSEVEAQDRCLAQELSVFFKQAARFLTHRDKRMGPGDLKPMKSREAVQKDKMRIPPDKINAAPLSDLGVEKTDYAMVPDKHALLQYYTQMLKLLRKRPGMTDEKLIPFYMDALDFLVQLPSEAEEAMRLLPQKSGRHYRAMNHFFRQSYHIIHELSDFAYMAGHPVRKTCPMPRRRPLIKKVVPYPIRHVFKLFKASLA